jgi:opacity protein-like surface antigen
LGGGQLGYQQQFGHFVIGVEVDFDGTTGNGDRATTTNNFVTPMFTTPGNTDGDTVISVLNSKHRTKVDWQGSFRGRLGYASGRFLLYGTGGAAFTQVRSSGRDTLTSNVFDTPAFTPEEGGTQIHSSGPGRDDSTLLGWTGGGGAEYALCNAVTLGVEYRHNDFGSENLQFAKPNPRFVTSGNTRWDLSADQVTLRINILLGHLGRLK